MSANNNNNNAFLIHISAFAGYVFPFGSVLLPLILWNVKKEKNTILDAHGKAAVNFNLSFYLYTFILGLSLVPLTLSTFFRNFRHFNDFDHFNFDFSFTNFFGFVGFSSLISVLIITKFVLIVVAAIKASKGEFYNYPLSINFLK